MIANQAQQAVWRYDNTEPFSDSSPDENPSGLGVFEFPLRRAGEYADKETGDFYNYFRSLDPALDRYKQSDPIGLAAGVNTYAHVLSDPLRRIDPRGLATTIPGPGGIPVPIPTPLPAPGPTAPGSKPGGSLIPPEFDPNNPPRPQSPQGIPIITPPEPLPPEAPKPPGMGCRAVFEACVKGAQVCPVAPLRGTLYALCFAAWLACEAANF